MIVKDLIGKLETCDADAEVILVVYTNKGYESGYADRIDIPSFNSVTKEKLTEDEIVVEIATSTRVN